LEVIEITLTFLPHSADPAGLGSGLPAPAAVLAPFANSRADRKAVLSARPHCLVIDGHPLVRLGVRETLQGGFHVHESKSRQEAVELIRDIGSIDVAIVDLRRGAAEANGSLSGAEAIRALRQAEPGLGIVAHGERAERHIATAALQAGATAYVSRAASAEDLRRAVDAALAQEQFIDPAVPPKGSRGKLTRRQREILQLLADGGSTALAARELGLSEETVKTHTKNAVARLDARNRTHAVAMALRESLID
jgi:DNA-binding NarL/FixJ family response regulator